MRRFRQVSIKVFGGKLFEKYKLLVFGMNQTKRYVVSLSLILFVPVSLIAQGFVATGASTNLSEGMTAFVQEITEEPDVVL